MIAPIFFRRKSAGLLACATFVFVATGTLFGQETITLSEAGYTSESFSSLTDTVSAVTTFGDWTINVTAIGVDAGSSATPDLDLIGGASTLVASPGELVITFTDDGFTSIPVSLVDTVGGSDQETQSTFSAEYTDTGTTTIAGLGYASLGGTSAFSNNSPSAVISPDTTPYGLGLVADISADGTSTHVESFDMNLFAPEPSFYALTGVGLAVLLAAAIRRRKKQAVV